MKNFVLKIIWNLYQGKRYLFYYFNRFTTRKSITNLRDRIKNNELLKELDLNEQDGWKNRIKKAISSSDNKFIHRVENAGKIEGNYLIMHNGLKIDPLSYYGPALLKLLTDNQGVHEPQEERVFQEVLKFIKPGATMIELGSYWSFYSMWFKKSVEKARCFMIEPELSNIKFGKKNFRLNQMKGSFYNSYVGDKSLITHKGDRFITVDDFIRKKGLTFIDVLHSDIQGAEYRMLLGARNLFDQGMLGYVFISTHSNEIHNSCLEFLKGYDFSIIAESNLDESYSEDGLIAAKAPYYKGIDEVKISKRTDTKNE